MGKEQLFTMLSLLLMLLTHKCDSLKCHKCDAKDNESCEETQVTEHCRHRHAVCMTQSFDISYDDGTRKHFKKGCVEDKSFCTKKCAGVPDDVMNCQVMCCHSEFCNNNDPANKKKIFYQNKQKRSSVQSNLSRRSRGNIATLTLCGILAFVLKLCTS